MAFYVPIGCVRFAGYCGKMSSKHWWIKAPATAATPGKGVCVCVCVCVGGGGGGRVRVGRK